MTGERPRPPVTITVPGQPPLAPGPVEEPALRAPGPRRRRVRVLALVGGLLAAGTLVATAESPPVRSAAAGLTARAELEVLPRRGALAVRLRARVDGEPGLPEEQRRVRVVGVTGRGLSIVPLDGALPLVAELGEDGGGSPFRLEVSVSDCSVEPSALRQLDVAVSRRARTPGGLVVVSEPDVVRALERLVARTCDRPHG